MSKKKSIVKKIDVSKLSKVNEYIPSPDVLNFISQLTAAYTENKITEREIERTKAIKEVLITEIQNKYAFYREVFNKIFGERKTVIEKNFEIIELGLKENNKDFVLQGLSGINQIVSSSPFANAEALAELMNNNKKIEF